MLKTEEKRREFFLIFSIIQLCWNFLFFIPCAFSWVIWGLLLIVSGCTAWLSYKKAGMAPRVIWVIAALVRWFAIAWAVYECIFLGFDTESIWDICMMVAALVFTIGVMFLPAMAFSIKRHVGRKEGKYATLLSSFCLAFGLCIHGVEPFKVGTILRLTSVLNFPSVIEIICCVLSVLLTVFVFVLSIMALPVKETQA